MKCRKKGLISCSNRVAYWQRFNQTFYYLRLCSDIRIFYLESGHLQIAASATPYDGSLHLHMNLLINAHYHIWEKPSGNTQERKSIIYPEVKNILGNNLLKLWCKLLF